MITKPRRGVLLLVVLALLAMFAVVALAFVVLTGVERRSADRVRTIDTVVVSPAKQLNSAFDIVVRGSNNPQSAIGSCSLLEKIYGTSSGTVSLGGITAANGQLLSVNVSGLDPMHQMGCTVTMLTGPAAGLSARIGGPTFPGNIMPGGGDVCVINGFPYGGMGYGYNKETGLLDAKDDSGRLLAMLPRSPKNLNPPGGANCDYTAPDFQDPLLAGVGEVNAVSLHRPNLIQYWTTQLGSLNADISRQIMFRPNTFDHPNFPTSGQLDVDNDGDGVPDSVWVDLGFPVSFTADGRPYKPMFAILCLDMDGRLNLNAHGNLAQAQTRYYEPVGLPYTTLPLVGSLPGDTALPTQINLPAPLTAMANKTFAGGAPRVALSRGQGYGPAEVNLLSLFGSSNTSIYQALLTGGSSQLGRYGENVGTGRAGSISNRTGYFNNGYMGLTWNRWFSYGEYYWTNLTSGTSPDSWGSPPDTQGFGAIGLDVAGRPLYISMGGTLKNTPYDIDLSRNAPHATGAMTPDSPFSVSELERIIRPYDRDVSSLPQRLEILAGPALRLRRTEITTESFSVPTAPVVFSLSQRAKGIANGLSRPTHPVDLITARTGKWDSTKAADLLPWETQQGLKMNVNRPFGAGGARSSNGSMTNGATKVEPDQPGLGGESVALYGSSGTASVSFSYDAAGATTNSLAARQLYAKHLYVLMTLTADTDAIKARLGSDEARARLIAQWAVNCVAFRDHNAIMIPFNYVVDPDTSGWNPDGTAAHTVWGCKRPDLIISETLAFHDRRTEDLSDEVVDPANTVADPAVRTDPGKTTDTEPKNKDPNFDQKYRPQGSLFVELLNPWSPLEPQSRDLLGGAPATGGAATTVTSGVLLSQTSGTSGTGHPVWRLVIVNPLKSPPVNGEIPDPDDSDSTKRPQIERAVYFVSKGTATIPTDVLTTYTPSVGKPLLVSSGQYAVIGSGEKDPASPNKKQTLIGFSGASKDIKNRAGRYITLDDTEVTTANPSPVRNNTPAPPAASAIKLPLVLSIDTPRRLSVSEPTDGYTKYEKTPDGAAVTYNPDTETYSQTIDIPFDLQREKDGTGDKKLNNDGTYPGFRIIYLQRLADPTRSWVSETDASIKDGSANPYRTIDAMPVDLTTFNGVTTVKDPNNTPVDIQFASRQRGDTNAASGEFNLWKQEAYNKSIVKQVPAGANVFGYDLVSSLGYLNTAFGVPKDLSTGYQGDPPFPFPWFNWAYRPFVNEYELLQVPAVSSSKLLVNNGNTRSYYGYVDGATLGSGINAYSGSNFPHLLNMFDTGQFHRILAYVGIPSPYVNMQIQAPGDSVHAPFNGIPTYREPGRINLNTISSLAVFQGMAYNHPAASASMWDKFRVNRLAQPYRTAGGAGLSPTNPSREIDVTLLRSDPGDATRPLFQVDNKISAATPATEYNRSSYFRYQAIQKLGGVTTCHSNVFAVWITVGYFEVTPNAGGVDAGHPDGYQLGQELGGDSGDTSRHRAFYMIDRSIPVGFIRGQDVNHSKAVLVKRFIE